MIHVFESTLRLEQPLETIFAFFSAAENLAKITPPEMKFRMITASPITMSEGTRIEYRLRIMGLPLKWKSLISRWNPPHTFVDEQLSGPYAFWKHTHRFEADGHGTLVMDEVHYALPFSPFSEPLHFLVRRQLEHIFAFRREAIRREMAD